MLTGFTKKIRAFISYPGSDGLAIAKELADILVQEGHKVWLFENHRTWGASTWREISINITDQSDVFIYVCTGSSLTSRGQELETGYALDARRVKPLVLIINGAVVPPELTGMNYEEVTTKKLEERLKTIARSLPSTLARIYRLEEAVKAKAIPADNLQFGERG